MKKCLVALLLFCFALPLCAETAESVPNPLRSQRSWVSDVAQVIEASDETNINRAIEELKNRTKAEIAVVTVQNTGDEVPKDFATALFKRWGVGKKGDDNGVLVLLVMQKRRVEVETGYGVEGDLPDALIGQILREQAVPQFKQSNYGGGLLAVVQEFSRVLSGGAASAGGSGAAPPKPRDTAPPISPEGASPVAPRNPAPGYNPSYNQPVYDTSPTVSGPFDLIIGLFFLLMFPVGGAVLLWVVFSLVKNLNTRRCPQCQRTMRYLNEQEDDAFLDEAQRLEEQLGGLDWRVWRCDDCGIEHIERSVKWFGGYEDCPRCSHHTVQFSSATLRHPTEYSEGVREVTRLCHFPNCGYTQRTHETLPRQQRHTNVVILGGGIGSSGGSWGGGSSSSSSDSGFSSSSGDFGGGSSGGGGAGADW